MSEVNKINEQIVANVFDTVHTLKEFRENVVQEGSGKLLDAYDALIKSREDFLENVKNGSGSVFLGLFGFTVLAGPWAFGVYKIFA